CGDRARRAGESRRPPCRRCARGPTTGGSPGRPAPPRRGRRPGPREQRWSTPPQPSAGRGTARLRRRGRVAPCRPPSRGTPRPGSSPSGDLVFGVGPVDRRPLGELGPQAGHHLLGKEGEVLPGQLARKGAELEEPEQVARAELAQV